MLANLIRHILRAFLFLLEKIFKIVRKRSIPPYPYDKPTKTIFLPTNIEKELRHLVLTGNKVEAVKRVTRLTGAGLRVSKDYVDNLAGIPKNRRQPHRR